MSIAVPSVESSTHLIFTLRMGCLLVNGWVISCPIPLGLGFGPVPLNRIYFFYLNRIKNKFNPNTVPAAVPPGIWRQVKVWFKYRIFIDLPDR